jgi:hypothetical protein
MSEKPVLPPLPSNLTGKIGRYGWALRSPFGLDLLRRGRDTMGRMPVSYVAMMCGSSSGISYELLVSVFVTQGENFTYMSIDLELGCFVLRLHHEQRMVKQEYQEFSAITLEPLLARTGHASVATN